MTLAGMPLSSFFALARMLDDPHEYHAMLTYLYFTYPDLFEAFLQRLGK